MISNNYKQFFIKNYHELINQYKYQNKNSFKLLLNIDLMFSLINNDINNNIKISNIIQKLINDDSIKYKFQYFDELINTTNTTENNCISSTNNIVGVYFKQDDTLMSSEDLVNNVFNIIDNHPITNITELKKGYILPIENTGRILIYISNNKDDVCINNMFGLNITNQFITKNTNTGLIIVSKNILTPGGIFIKINKNGK